MVCSHERWCKCRLDLGVPINGSARFNAGAHDWPSRHRTHGVAARRSPPDTSCPPAQPAILARGSMTIGNAVCMAVSYYHRLRAKMRPVLPLRAPQAGVPGPKRQRTSGPFRAAVCHTAAEAASAWYYTARMHAAYAGRMQAAQRHSLPACLSSHTSTRTSGHTRRSASRLRIMGGWSV